MIKTNDIFIVHVTDDMVVRAVEYAEKSLQYTFNRMGLASHYDRLRNIVKGIVMEGAFKKLLDYHGVRYDLLGCTHWTKKDRYDVQIEGHKYDLKGTYVGDEEKRRLIEDDCGWLLDCSALVPADQIASRSLMEDDVYLFPFMTGGIVRDIGHLYGLFGVAGRKYLIHTFWDYRWFKNETWRTLGNLSVESKMRESIRLRVGGQGADKEIVVDNVTLAPLESAVTDREFYTALFVQTEDTPSGQLLVKSKESQIVERIGPLDWGNVWVYDSLVYITGQMSKGEFRARSEEIPRFFKGCKQYAETKTVNRTLLVRNLDSLRPMLPRGCETVVP